VQISPPLVADPEAAAADCVMLWKERAASRPHEIVIPEYRDFSPWAQHDTLFVPSHQKRHVKCVGLSIAGSEPGEENADAPSCSLRL